MHIQLIRQYWDAIVNNTVQLQKQDESQATVWPGRKPEDGEILPSMTMEEASRLVRAVTHPYPGAFYRKEDGSVVPVWQAATSPLSGAFRLADGWLTPLE
jgi:methionyl-tRNA formyltransferase